MRIRITHLLCIGWCLLCTLPHMAQAKTQTLTLQFAIQQLKHPNPKIRINALLWLERLGPYSLAALPLAKRSLAHKSWALRKQSARTIGFMGPTAREAIPHLVRLFKDKRWEVRAAAAQAVGRIGPTEFSVIRALCTRLKDKHVKVKLQAAFALSQGRYIDDHTFRVLKHTAKDKDWQVRMFSIKALPNYTRKKRSLVHPLQKALQDSEPAVHLLASQLLGEVGPKAGTTAVYYLKRIFKKGSLATRKNVLNTLGLLGRSTPYAVHVLTKHLRSNIPEVREQAIIHLAMLGTKAAHASGTLVSMLHHPKPKVRRLAEWAIFRIGKKTLSKLKDILYKKNHLQKKKALVLIGKFGKEAAFLAPHLVNKLRDGHWEIRRFAAKTILQVGPSIVAFLLHKQVKTQLKGSVVKWLIAAMRDKQVQVHVTCLQILYWLGKDAQSALPTVKKFQASKHKSIRILVQKIVKRLQNNPTKP